MTIQAQETSTPEKQRRSKEIRLGLVMYGGVSLAIYINGVSRELFEVARNKASQAKKGVYDLLKDAIDADVVIDILSGTSAGGINAILLAYALTNGKDFHSTADFWRRNGDIEDLLKKPEKQQVEADFQSVLNGGYYLDQVVQAFRKMPAMKSNGHCDKGQKSELDLFVTGTNVAGRIYTVFDDQGVAIDVKDHRTVFQLKHRPGRKEPFTPQNTQDPEDSRYRSEEECYQALGKLARITSSFPVAFDPVQVTPDDTSGPDKFLTQWGQLYKWTGSGTGASPSRVLRFMDGGLLDNKPFTHTIQEIFNRTADRQVERYLLYLEPDPERFSPKKTDTTRPSLLESAFRGAYSIPTYESIAEDLKLINQHNARIEQRNRLADIVRKKQFGTGDPIIPGPECGCDLQASLAIAARLEALQNRALKGILKDRGQERFVDSTEQKELLQSLIRAFLNWPGKGEDTLRDFDVYFRQRRVQHLIYLIYDLLCGDQSPSNEGAKRPSRDQSQGTMLTDEEAKSLSRAESQPTLLTALWKALNRHFKLLGIIQFAMEEGIDRWSIITWPLPKTLTAEKVWQDTNHALFNLLAYNANDDEILMLSPSSDTSSLDSEQLSKLHRTFQKRIVELERAFDAGDTARISRSLAQGNQSILKWSDKGLHELFTSFQSRLDPDLYQYLIHEVYGFSCLDAFLYPLEHATGRPEYDIIKLARLSSLDVKGGCNNLHPFHSDMEANQEAGKEARIGRLAGRTLAHFGGFLKQSWRANDILWGRLDAASKLIELLLSDDHLRDSKTQGRLKVLLCQSASYFPNAHTVFADVVASLCGPASPNAGQWRDLVTDMAHYEILFEEAGPLFESVIDQQFKWQTGAFRVKAQAESVAKDQPWFIWKRHRGISADPILGSAYSQIAARDFTDRLKKLPTTPAKLGETKLAIWFRMVWSTISREAEQPLKTPPPVVMANLLLQMAVVLRNCLLREFPEELRSSLKRQAWYRLLLGFPLDAALATVRSWREEPITFVVLRTIGIALPLFILSIQVLLGETIGQEQDSVTIRNLFLWWGIPFFVLWISIGHVARLILGMAIPFIIGAVAWCWPSVVSFLQALGNHSITAMDALAVGIGAALITSIILRWMNQLWKT